MSESYRMSVAGHGGSLQYDICSTVLPSALLLCAMKLSSALEQASVVTGWGDTFQIDAQFNSVSVLIMQINMA